MDDRPVTTIGRAKKKKDARQQCYYPPPHSQRTFGRSPPHLEGEIGGPLKKCWFVFYFFIFRTPPFWEENENTARQDAAREIWGGVCLFRGRIAHQDWVGIVRLKQLRKLSSNAAFCDGKVDVEHPELLLKGLEKMKTLSEHLIGGIVGFNPSLRV